MRKFGRRKLGTGMLLFGMAMFCLMGTPVQAADVPIDEGTFPDSVFREYVKSECDTDENGTLSEAEIAEVTAIPLESKGVTSLQGIEVFSELTMLHCAKNSLTELDISHNNKLQTLDCSNNKIENLDLDHNPELESLNCEYNVLTKLNVAEKTKLVYLCCEHNDLEYLGISGNTALKTIVCDSNNLTSLNTNGCTALTTLDCGDNQLTDLALYDNLNLDRLSCGKNRLTELDVSGNPNLRQLYCANNQLTALDVSKNIALTDLVCIENQLVYLDVSKNTAIQKLECGSNRLTELLLGDNSQMTSLSCEDNQLTALDVSKNTALQILSVFKNAITSLDLSRNPDLGTLECYSNQLTSLDVSGKPNLYVLLCADNHITSLDISQNTNLSFLNMENNPLMILKVSNAYSANAYFDKNLSSNLALTDVVQVDLGQCAGWDAEKISNITGAKLVGDVLVFDPMATEVSYRYSCDYECYLDVHFDISLSEYQITYQLDGGTNAAANPTSYYPVSQDIALENPVKEGYTFDGWYMDAAFTTKMAAIPKGHTGDVTLYAKWTKTLDPSPVTPNPATPNPVTPTQPSTGETPTGTDAGNTDAGNADAGQKQEGTQVPSVGTRVTDKKSKAVYRVVETSNGQSCVEYVQSTNKNATTVSIPEQVTIDGVTYRVVAIAKNAFRNHKKLKKVVIPKTVEKIGSKAFYGCKNLTRITIKTTKLTAKKIGSKAFTKAGSKNYKKLTVKVPKAKKKAYTSMLRKRGIHKKAKVK